MAFLHLNFDNFEFRDLSHSDFLSFKVLAPTLHTMYPCRLKEALVNSSKSRTKYLVHFTTFLQIIS